MKTVKLMTANRSAEGESKIEVFGDISHLTFESAGKGHNTKLQLATADLESAALKILAASPRFRANVNALNQMLKARDASDAKIAADAKAAASAPAPTPA